MSQHLSGEQLSAWMAGDRPAALASHLEGCAECRSQVTRFEGVLTQFREGAREVAAERRVPVIEVPERGWHFGPRWVLAGALAVMVSVVPFYRESKPVPAPVMVAEVSDSVLFEQVNAQLARRVPGAMEPLEALAWPEGKGE